MKIKRILGKICKIILLIIVLLIVYFVINNIITNYRDKKFKEKINSIKSEEVVSVIVEINPSIVFKVKNGTIIESQCLNKDCEDLLEKINYTYNDNINNQKLDKIINVIYEESKKEGYNTSNGITVSSSSSIVEVLVNDIKEVKYKHITEKEEKETLENSGVNFKETLLTKDEYNNKLLNELKNDPDYNETYSCDIYDGEVKCYMKDFMAEIMKDFGHNSMLSKLAELEANALKFRRLLKKFDFKYNNDEGGLIIESITLGNGKTYDYTDKAVFGINDTNNVEIERIIIMNALEYGIETDAGFKTYMIPFTKVNLITKTYDNKDVIFFDGTKEIVEVQYGI